MQKNYKPQGRQLNAAWSGFCTRLRSRLQAIVERAGKLLSPIHERVLCGVIDPKLQADERVHLRYVYAAHDLPADLYMQTVREQREFVWNAAEAGVKLPRDVYEMLVAKPNYVRLVAECAYKAIEYGAGGCACCMGWRVVFLIIGAIATGLLAGIAFF